MLHFARPFSVSRLFVISAVLALASCTVTHQRAPVLERSPGAPVGATPPAASAPVVAKPNDPGAKYYTVRKGDTLYSIALQNDVDYRQVALWNNIDSSYVIHIDQVLRVSPPADTSGSVAQALPVTGSQVEVRPLGAAAGATGTLALGGAAAAGPAALKTGPLGLKRPYADATFADMSRPDEAQNPPPVAASASLQPVAPVVAPVVAATDEDNIGWIWPASGALIDHFTEGKNKGIDIGGKSGTPILAAGDGTVLYVGNGMRDYGNLLVVKHSPNFISIYAHNSSILVTENQNVKKGQKIAEMGNSDSPQVELHFEIRKEGKPVDPLKYLPAR